ncbi:hypothetical protein FB45DRAFT_861377 [Roridomyces roridus]|uniref:Uncharacterized protein n=1 Tax=Roridomyces roridus TaxID=1738132 RepID=A0AAD7CAJ6_9AGAR|nr:hypothetical protein FB45DRAFT_861377 [Roridomyces roridus]
MSTSDLILLRFEGSDCTYNIEKLPIPGYDDFTLLPLGTRLFIPKKSGLFTNRPIDRRSREVDLKEAVSWGLNGEEHVIYARASRHYCIRFIFNAERVLLNAKSQSRPAYKRLVRDAKFHSMHLQNSKIKGIIVPVHYGMWITNTGSWAGKVIMNITQYCGMHWKELQYSMIGTQANRELVGRTLEMLHDCGFNHGEMTGKRDLRPCRVNSLGNGIGGLSLSPWCQHHAIERACAVSLPTPPPLRNLTRPPDASLGATRHATPPVARARAAPCFLRLEPSQPSNRRSRRQARATRRGWWEDTDTDMSDASPQAHPATTPPLFVAAVTSKPLAWHDQYISKHPDVPNQYVMMEQRAQFFEHRTLYPALALVYDSEGRVDIQMASDSDDTQ